MGPMNVLVYLLYKLSTKIQLLLAPPSEDTTRGGEVHDNAVFKSQE